MNDFSNILKSLRQSLGLTQGELASKLKISKSAVSMYENSNREPDIKTLNLIADFFEVDMNYLLGHTNSNDKGKINTLAAHFDGEEYTAEELDEIKNFAEYVKNKRK